MTTSPAPSTAPGDHITVIHSGAQLTGRCAVCGDVCDTVNRGLGRATLAAWRTRHQHRDLGEAGTPPAETT